ncbi:MAG TPA: hypothetical protein VK875_04115, partial [Euzebyales bacterium]|nr:hypothetical protein [Euzebyales bacterium]
DRAGSHAPEGEAGPPPDSAGDGAPPPVPAPDVAAAPPERVRPTPPTPAPRPAGDVARSQPAGRSQQAPQPAGHAAPEPPSEGAGDSVDFDLIRQSWPAVLDRVKQRTIRMHALVNMSRPVHFDGATLGLEFKPGHRFHAEQCGGEEGQTVIGGALHDVLGVRPRLVCTVGDHEQDGGDPAHEAEAEAVAERELMEAAGDLPDEEQLHQQAIDTLRRNLGATVVNQPGS